MFKWNWKTIWDKVLGVDHGSWDFLETYKLHKAKEVIGIIYRTKTSVNRTCLPTVYYIHLYCHIYPIALKCGEKPSKHIDAII